MEEAVMLEARCSSISFYIHVRYPALNLFQPWSSPSGSPPIALSSLPDELFLHILSSSALRLRDLAAGCLVSHRWLPCARQVLYGERELYLPNPHLSSTPWNASHLRALVRKVRINAYANVDAESVAGWLCLPGVRLHALALMWSNDAVEAVVASASAALASLRFLSLAYTSIPILPMLDELVVLGSAASCTSATARSLTIRHPSMPLHLGGFSALRKLVLLCSPESLMDDDSVPLQWSDVPATVELLVVPIFLLGVDPSQPPPGLQIELTAPGLLSCHAARALSASVLTVSCECEDGALRLLGLSSAL